MPSERPKRRDGTGPNKYLYFSIFSIFVAKYGASKNQLTIPGIESPDWQGLKPQHIKHMSISQTTARQDESTRKMDHYF